ncbi:MAG: outer membrane beta-barrel protein [Candidatus Poribacteria bacterium]
MSVKNMLKSSLLLITFLVSTSDANAQNRLEIAGFAGIVNQLRSQGGGGERFIRPGISGRLNLTRKLGLQFDYAGRWRGSQSGTDDAGNFTEQTWTFDYFSTSLVFTLYVSRISPCIYLGFAFRRGYQRTTSTEQRFNYDSPLYKGGQGDFYEGINSDFFFDLGAGANWNIHSHLFVRPEFRAWWRPEIDSSSFIRVPVLRSVMALGCRF